MKTWEIKTTSEHYAQHERAIKVEADSPNVNQHGDLEMWVHDGSYSTGGYNTLVLKRESWVSVEEVTNSE